MEMLIKCFVETRAGVDVGFNKMKEGQRVRMKDSMKGS
jgi:hypothetical protein